MNIEKIEYRGWPNCCRLSNSQVDLVVTTDVGPRLIRFGFRGQPNELKEYAEQMGQVGGDEWRIYGGHRLWHAPEGSPRSYFPDNVSVEFQQQPGFVRLVQPVETTTGIQKELDIALFSQTTHVRVVHRLRNCSLWTVELAPWGLTVMATGGTAILPLPPRQSHEEALLPVNTLTLWAYTDLSDPRWTLGRQFILLRQDPSQPSPQKLGLMSPEGWIAYARDGHLFVKRTTFVPGAPYADFGCSLETFTDGTMLELETLGPLVQLPPGGTVEHLEDWALFSEILPPTGDEDVIRGILPRINSNWDK